jgi:hypothetical protein
MTTAQHSPVLRFIKSWGGAESLRISVRLSDGCGGRLWIESTLTDKKILPHFNAPTAPVAWRATDLLNPSLHFTVFPGDCPA